MAPTGYAQSERSLQRRQCFHHAPLCISLSLANVDSSAGRASPLHTCCCGGVGRPRAIFSHLVLSSSSSSSSPPRIRVMNHNWSARKQRLHSAECSRDKPPFSATVGHRLSLATRTQISVCKSPFPSAGTAVSLFRAKTVQQRPLLPREVETRSLRIVGSHTIFGIDHQLCLYRLLVSAGCKFSHSGFLDVSRRNGGLTISGWIGQVNSV